MKQRAGKLFGIALGFGFALSLLSTPSYAAKFANQFIEFELPPQWQCNLEGAEWVCQSTDPKKKRDAIIVMAAKLKGDQDSLDQYLNYLKAPKIYTSVKGKPMKSEVKYAKTSDINGHAWVDSLHLESEIPGFFTRYLATVKEDIGVLVTYSINKNKYQDYLADFEAMVKTIKVFRKPGGINAGPANGNLFGQAQIPQNIGTDTVFPGGAPQGGADDHKPVQKKSNNLPLILGGGALVAFFVWRKKRAG